MADETLAKDTFLYVNTGALTAPSFGKVVDITINGTPVDISSKASQWMKYLHGKTGWTIKAEMIWDVGGTVEEFLLSNVISHATFTVRMGPINAKNFDGAAVMTDHNIAAADGDAIKGTVTFLGSGALTYA